MNRPLAAIMKGAAVLAICLSMTCGAGYALYQNIMKTQ